jgi:hypothetical protein
MNALATAQILGNLDERTSRIEQRLHSVPTREEMNEAIRVAVEPLVTREELRRGIEEVKRHTRILFESVRDDIRLLAEQVLGLMNRPRG